MVRNASIAAFRMRMRVILIVTVAVVASMTLHHGAMASAPAAHDQVEAHIHHPSEAPDCTGVCGTRPHSMPACCGMGLCLTGLPAEPQSGLSAERQPAKPNFHRGLIPNFIVSRIDRPPKNSVRAVV